MCGSPFRVPKGKWVVSMRLKLVNNCVSIKILSLPVRVLDIVNSLKAGDDLDFYNPVK